jgi:acyl carrier protein
MSANEVVANKVFTPKLAVSTLVDALKATLKQAIFFSSAASVLGTLAQSIYAGANFYLDQYASLLRNRGIAATSVAWGNIGEIGLAAADSKRGEQLAAKGINTFSKLQFHLLLEQIMGIQKSQVLAIDIDFKRWSSAYSELTQNAYFEAFVPQHIQVVQGEDIYSMANLAAAERSIRKTLKDHISAITKIASTAVKEDVTFKSLGIDSMMAVQLKNKIQDSFKTTIAVANIWAYPTVEKFTKFLVVQLGLEEKYLPKKESPVGATTNNELNVDDMSLEDLMRELEEKSK